MAVASSYSDLADAYTHANPHEITMLSFGILAGACVLSIPYARWARIDGEGDTGTA